MRFDTGGESVAVNTRTVTKEELGRQKMFSSKVENLLSNAMVSWNLMLSKDIEWNIVATDHLFCKNTWINATETNKEKIKQLYEVGYKDWMRYFKKLRNQNK